MNRSEGRKILGLVLLITFSAGLATAQQTDQGLAELAQGRLQEAIRLLSAAVRENPQDSRAARGLAQSYLRSGQVTEAIFWFRRTLELLPDDVRSRFELARILSWRRETRTEAYAHFEQVLRMQPENTQYRLAYADALSWEPARQAEAIQQLEQVLRRDPHNVEVRRKRAEVLNWKGQREAAIKAFQEILSEYPDNTQVLQGLGQAYEWGGQLDRAVETYRRLLAADPQNVGSKAALARILSWRRETRKEAYELYDDILRQQPEDTESRMAYAEALSWEPQRQLQAVAEYERVLQQDPRNRAAQVRLAMVWSWRGKLRRAEELYDRVLAQDPNEEMAVVGKSEVLTWSGRHFEANRWLRRLEKQERPSPRLLMARAGADYGIGRMDQSRKLLKSLLQQEPTNPYAADLYQAIEDWRRPQLETGFSFMRESGDPFTSRVEFNRPFLRLRLPAGGWSRFEFSYEPTDYFNRAAKRRDQGGAIGWEGQPSDHLRLRGRIQFDQYDIGSTDVTGSFTLGWLVNDRLRMDFGLTRGVLLDSVQAVGGVLVNGQLIGRARTNLFEYTLGYNLPLQRVDLSFHYSHGTVTGSSIATNPRLGFDFGVGKAFKLGEKQFVRLGYGFIFFGFEKDFGFFPNPTPTPTTGGYFSPTQFFNNAGQLGFWGNLNRRWYYYFGGSLGVQQAETTFSQLGKKRMSSYVSSTHTVRLTGRLHLLVSYEYINVGGAFRRNTVSTGFRVYF